MISIASPTRADIPAIADLLSEMDTCYGDIYNESDTNLRPQVEAALFGPVPADRALLATVDGRLADLATYSFPWPAVGLTQPPVMPHSALRDLLDERVELISSADNFSPAVVAVGVLVGFGEELTTPQRRPLHRRAGDGVCDGLGCVDEPSSRSESPVSSHWPYVHSSQPYRVAVANSPSIGRGCLGGSSGRRGSPESGQRRESGRGEVGVKPFRLGAVGGRP